MNREKSLRIHRVLEWGVVGSDPSRTAQDVRQEASKKEKNAGLITRSGLEELLNGRRRLRVKLGIDPTSRELHLGHAVVLRKLRQFQDLGHRACLIVGDFTAQIGDPSGEKSTRPALTTAQVRENMVEYERQAAKVIDLKKAEILYNSKWLAKINFTELVREYASKVSLNEIIERQDFRERLEERKSVSLHELLYPLAQAIDSCQIEADVEIGGWDQRLNLLLGRELQAKRGQKPQQIVLMKPLIGLDGKRKMSSSYHNFIALDDEPTTMFGKIMSLPDGEIESYAELAAGLGNEADAFKVHRILFGEGKFADWRERKLYVAERTVAFYWGERKAGRAREAFVETFSHGRIKPELVTDLYFSPGEYSLLEIIKNAAEISRSEAERLFQQRAVRLDGKLTTNMYEKVFIDARKKLLLQVGKHRFWRLLARR